MSDSGEHDGHSDGAASGEVLRNLPRTRPQRPSSRRVHDAGETGSADAAPAPTRSDAPETETPPRRRVATPAAAKRSSAKAKPRAAAPRTSGGARAASPRHGTGARAGRRGNASASSRAPQGFEAERGGAVDPPSAGDVLDSALGAAGDLMQAGLGLGGRAVRGALSRLRRG